MANTEVTWLVSKVDELGQLEERLAGIDATVEETWPGGADATVVVLVRAAPNHAADAGAAVGGQVQRIDDEGDARRAAAELARSR